jgi:hypothetical protein
MARNDDHFYAWRAVAGAEGYLGVNTLPAEFGLGGSAAVDLEIVWPGGRRQIIEKVPADHRLRVYEVERFGAAAKR